MSPRVAGGRLVFLRAAFLPDGLHAGGETFPWEQATNADHPRDRWPGEPAAGWMVTFLPDLRAFQVTTVVAVCELRSGEAVPRVVIGRYWEPFAPLVVPSYAGLYRAQALGSFLRDEPRARAGLADPARVTALAAALRRFDPHGALPREPLAGDAYDLHWAAVRAYRAALPRRYHDLRADTDPLPADLVARTRSELPARLRERFSEAEIAARVRRLAGRPAWPFGILL